MFYSQHLVTRQFSEPSSLCLLLIAAIYLVKVLGNIEQAQVNAPSSKPLQGAYVPFTCSQTEQIGLSKAPYAICAVPSDSE